MNTTLRCNHCGKMVEVSEALGHELQEEVEKIKKIAEETTRKAIEGEFQAKSKQNDAQLEEERKRNKELAESITNLVKEKKQEEEKIRINAMNEAAVKSRLEKLEYEKRLSDMQKALEDAQRKGKQGSQQLQGEVLELDLEEQLKSQFPQDEFLPIPKGIEGADIWQKVRDAHGRVVGSILWETKRTKNWDKKWLPKLREDVRRANAGEAILVTEVLPNEIKSFHLLEKVWVTSYEFAVQVARIVRFILLKVDAAKSTAGREDGELRDIYQFITSDAFRHRIEAHDEAVKMMREDLFSEIRLTQTRWKRRETQINRLDTSVSQLYGELQGIIPTLPDISTEALPSGVDE